MFYHSSRFKEIVRFGVTGILATLVLYSAYWIFLHGLSPSASYSLAYLFAFMVNYILTTSFTFKVKKTVKNGAGFIVSNIINYFVSIGLLNLFLYMGCSEQIAPIPTILIATLSNYIIVRIVMKKTQ